MRTPYDDQYQSGAHKRAPGRNDASGNDSGEYDGDDSGHGDAPDYRSDDGGLYALSIVIGCIVASAFYGLLARGRLEHTALVFIGVPAVLAAAVALFARPRSATGMIVVATTIALMLSSVMFGEGFVCIIMAAPLFYAIAIPVGKVIDFHRDRDRRHRQHTARVCVMLALIVPCSVEGVVPGWEFSREATVTVERIVDGSPEQVEAALARTPTFDRPLPSFFTRLRFPTPGKTTGQGLQPGDRREIEFLHSAHNAGHHPGILTLDIRERAPGRVVFGVREDHSYITHWLSWRSSEVTWEPIAPGRTRVAWTLSYRRRLDPAWYFAPLERYAVGLAAGYLIDTLATPHAGAQ